MRFLLLISAALMIGGCAANIIPSAQAAPRIDKAAPAVFARPAIDRSGLDAVMGKDIGALKRMFGEPRLDVVEVIGRKLQFVGTACILDTYLYPEGRHGAEIVTHIDARRTDGAAVDRASCVDAFRRR